MSKRKKYWQYRYQLWVDGVMIAETKQFNIRGDYENIAAIRTHYSDLITGKDFQIYKIMPADPDPVIDFEDEPREIKPIEPRPEAKYSNRSAMGIAY